MVKVVGLTYYDIVEANEKDVLLVYCITHCGPCDYLNPTLVTLAELYAADEQLRNKVTVGIINYELNDVPERWIFGFPTLMLFLGQTTPRAASVRPGLRAIYSSRHLSHERAFSSNQALP